MITSWNRVKAKEKYSDSVNPHVRHGPNPTAQPKFLNTQPFLSLRHSKMSSSTDEINEVTAVAPATLTTPEEPQEQDSLPAYGGMAQIGAGGTGIVYKVSEQGI
jgi:hypothetical protein